MRTVEQMWQGYHEKVYPDGMDEDQEIQLRQAFYAGVYSMLMEMHTTGGKSEEEGVAYLQATSQECQTFFIDSVAQRLKATR